MDRNQRQLELLRQIQHAAGLDPDGPRLVPMQARLSPEETQRALRRASEAATRDAMLRRAILIGGGMLPAYNQSDWLFVIALRRSHIEVTHDGLLKIKFEESADSVAKELRDYIIRESNNDE